MFYSRIWEKSMNVQSLQNNPDFFPVLPQFGRPDHE